MKKDVLGFLKIKRQANVYRDILERIKDNKDVLILKKEEDTKNQACRCMDCGTPFCHSSCPLGNIIPEWNELIWADRFQEAFKFLHSTNVLPEVTGRICPALCEASCVLGINDDPITIRDNELFIVEKAFSDNFIKANPPKIRIHKRVAVIGSGPAGISTAYFLNQKGYEVTIFEKDENIGGILRYGIPDFKLEKYILERRIKILKDEGIIFKTKVNVGIDYKVEDLNKNFDAICIAIGSKVPRDIKIKGRELDGIHFAMDFLINANKSVSGEKIKETKITAKDKNVVVIGGGDTGADCVGVCIRQGAKSVTQIEIMPKPPKERPLNMPWPKYPTILRTSSSHQEGGKRYWEVSTKEFIGENGKLKALKCEKVKFGLNKDVHGKLLMNIVQNSEFEIAADLAILAMGFTNPEKTGLLENLSVEIDSRGNIKACDSDFKTNVDGVFACGDARRGASLIVWALFEGKSVADNINEYLKSKK
ncbi:MAG: glutamate synthase subunit beta [Elusimicrobiota bacterium]|nr:glutamate synthase subunit beta [Elusimicrobiota bacterium]